MFMWDVFERLVNVPGLDLQQHALPVIRSTGEVMKAIEILRGLPEGQDITHGQYGSLIGLFSSFSKAKKIISLRGSEIYPGQGALYERLAGRIRQLLSYMAALRADSVLVMSNAMRDIVIRWPGIKRDVVHVLPDPAGAAFWPEADRHLGPLLAQTRLTIVTASIQKNNPIKRNYLIEQAVNLCRAAGLNVDFQAITGVSRDEVLNILTGSDMVALASTHEGWPNIIKEGLLLGKAFATTGVSDLQELANADPRHRIVPPSPVDFAFAFVDALVAKTLKLEGFELRLVAFHPDACAIKHRIVYQHYAARGGQ